MNLFGWLNGNLFSSLFGAKTYTVTSRTQQDIINAWKSVNEALTTKTPSQLRQALITCDKCVDNALRDLVAGETMGERLKNAREKFEYSVYDGIWRAHKIRNSMVHETSFEPSYATLISAIGDMRKGLDALGVKVR